MNNLQEQFTVGSIIITYSKMTFLIIRSDNEKQFQVVDLTNVQESKLNYPKFDTLHQLYRWFGEAEGDGIEIIIPHTSLEAFVSRTSDKN